MSSAVEAQGLTVRFGDFTAVDDVTFKVESGEIFGFLGANGAGKTTTIRVLCGLLEPTSGKVRVAGLSPRDGMDAIKSKVGYMSQKFTLYNDLSVIENLEFAASLRRIPRDVLQRRTRELLELIDFDRSLKVLVRDLPGGIKQKVSLVAATLHDPQVIFLDEPTAGVTPAARARFWDLIRKLASEGGKTVFVTTHYMDEAEQCGRIALMRAGRLIALDSPEGLKRSTFPEPILQITPPAGASRGWAERFKTDTRVAEVQPYGLKYHLILKRGESVDLFRESLPENASCRTASPTLEDVFIRLVEGVNR